jgi:hypothetical protein
MDPRHPPRDRPFELVGIDETTEAAVVGHITAHLGPVDWVYHEFLSDLVHVDLHVVAPTPERNVHSLVTCGMSDRAMTVPDGTPSLPHAELVLHLPPDWPLAQEDFADERHFWPIRWLTFLARLPHEDKTWLDVWHTMPNGDPPQPFAENTGLCALMLTPPLLAPAEFALLRTPAGKEIAFHEVLPLHAAELRLKREAGTDALIDRLDAGGVGPVVDPARPSCVP